MTCKRITSLCLTAVLTAALLCSCGIVVWNGPPLPAENAGAGETAEAGGTAAETGKDQKPLPSGNTATPVKMPDNKKAAENYLGALTKRDFEGVGVVIGTADSSRFTPDGAASSASAARLLRNRMVEEKYNTIIMTKLSANTSVMLDEAQKSMLSGMFYADLTAVPASDLGLFQARGLLFNLNTLPFTDFTAPYYNRDAMKQMSAGYSTFGAAGALTEDLQDMHLIFFNKALTAKYTDENPYLLAEDGTWTWDKMLGIITEVNRDINAEGNSPPTGHASQTGTDTYIDILFASAGLHYMTTGTGIIPYPSFSTPGAKSLIETANRLLYKDSYYLYAEGEENAAVTGFYDGRLLFCAGRLYASSWFVNMKDAWGILPLPKLSPSQANYYTYLDPSVPVMTAAAGGTDVEKSGLMLQALTAASWGFINDTYYTELSNNVFRDNDSVNMLDLIRRFPRYDFAYMFGSAYTAVQDGTFRLLRKAVRNASALEPAYSSYLPLIAKQMERAFEMPIR